MYAASHEPRNALLDAVASGRARSVGDRDDLALWPELRAMAATIQDREWHAEGDVLVHTDMVLREAAGVEAHLPSESARRTLRLASLLHDVAKPGMTRYDADVGHVIARGHERRGGVVARYLLHGLGLAPAERRAVAALVATHHLVKRSVKGIDAPGGVAALEALATRVDTRLLWALELADMRGRIARDRDAQIEIVELFRMLCEERGLFGAAPAPWVGADDVARIGFADERAMRWALAETERRRLTGELRDAHAALAFCHEHAGHAPADVVITVGVAGSGKSRWIERTLGDEYVRLSPDDVRAERHGAASVQRDPGPVHAACRQRLREVLRRGGCAVYDATNVTADLRARLVGLCHEYRARVRLVVFDTPRELALARNAGRTRRVPEAVIDGQIAKFEWPAPTEAHAIDVVDDVAGP